jgi:hypothetical protein
MKQEPTMECPYCKEIEFEHIDTLTGQGKRTLEYKCNDCQQIAYFDESDDEQNNEEQQLQQWAADIDANPKWIEDNA